MSNHLLPEWADLAHPVIGMLHLPPLPGAPGCVDDLESTAGRVLADAEALVTGGVHGLMMENYGDAPFYPDRVPACVVAYMTRLAASVRALFDAPLGINVLRNDGRSALAIAHAAGAAYIRVNVLCGARVADQGILHGMAHELLRERVQLGATAIRIFADVNVKHSAPLGAARSVADEVADLCGRGGADAIIVSGAGTGRVVDLEELKQAKAAAGDVPLLVGSGVTPETIETLLPHADGFIVGSSLKVDGVAHNPVDPQRVTAFMARFR